MRAGWLGAAAGIVAGVAAVLWSCTGDNRSDALKCSSSATCDQGRVCMQGYCVVGTFRDAGPDAPIDAAICPSVCLGNQCNFATHTCNVTGTGSGTITCPSGWNCVIGCAGSGACGDIHCTQSSSCKITCSAADSCGNITCSAGTCNIECDGNGTIRACGNIDCTNARCTDTCLGSIACSGLMFGAGGGSATCNGGSACANITCSAGPCNIDCTGGSAACGTIGTDNGSAVVTCNGSNACGDITTGSGSLNAMCLNGSAACGAINCATSCQCDVACSPLTNCGVNTCPPSNMGSSCTTTGLAGAACDSTFRNNCKSMCP